MALLYNRAGVATSTSGTGTITLGAALSSATAINACSFLTFANAGASNAETVSYLILDSNGAWEVGTGVYTTAGTTLTRVLTISSTGSLLSLTGTSQVFITARKEDILTMTETRTANTVLAGPTSGGAAVPTFRALVAADLPAGSAFATGGTVGIVFFMAAAPTAWTKQTTHNDKALRLVSGTGGGSGGSSAFTTVFGKTATDATTISTATMPSHSHTITPVYFNTGASGPALTTSDAAGETDKTTAATGSGGSHTHPMDIRVTYVDVIICTKD